MADVAGAFHRVKLPSFPLSSSGPSSLAAAELGLGRVDGQAGAGAAEAAPMAAALPTGIARSLCYAQDVGAEAASSAIDRCELPVDRGRLPLLRCPRGGAVRALTTRARSGAVAAQRPR